MTSDEIKCAACEKFAARLGSGLRLYLGLKRRMCADCVRTIDARRAATA